MLNISRCLKCVYRNFSFQKNCMFHKWTKDFVKYSSEVSEAFLNKRPVVALESTVITHGLPYPDNLRTALKLEEIVRENSAVPATIGIVNGVIHIGMTAEEVEILASKQKECIKVSRRDLPFIFNKGLSGGTTVAGTMILAHKVGIPIFATGGIGGVHRDGEKTLDVSADLFELSRTPMTVVSAGVKSILDIGRTLEYLETLGVCVASFGSSQTFPSFFTPKSEHFAPYRVETFQEAAQLIDWRDRLELQTGILLAVPIPDEYKEDGLKTESVIQEALHDAQVKGVRGKEVTPFVLSRVQHLSNGASLRANIGLLENNAKVGSQIAVHLNNLKRCLCYLAAKKERPVVIGGSVLDIQVKTYEELKTDGRTVTGRIESTAGGVARNVADALSRLGTNPFFISAVGADHLLLHKMTHMDVAGVRVVEDARTAVCVVLLDVGGDCLYCIGDMEVHRCIDIPLVEEHKEMICKAPVVVIDGNIPTDTMQYVLTLCSQHKVPVWFEPTDVSVANGPFLFSTSLWRDCIAFASPNLNELRIIHSAIHNTQVSGATRIDTVEEADQLGRSVVGGSLQTLVVTLGDKGILLVTSQNSIHFPALETNEVVSMSGAGDCFAGGMLAGLLHGKSIEESVSAGQRAAILSIASNYTVPHTLGVEEFSNLRLKK